VSRILVIDDDELMLQSYVRSLGRLGYSVDKAGNGREAIERFRTSAFDVVITDLAMPDMDGLMFLREVRRFDLDVPVLIVTGAPSLDSAIEAVQYGAFRYIMKPVETEALADALARAVRLHEMARLRRRALSLVEENGYALGDRASLEARYDAAVTGIRMAFQPIVSWRGRSVYGYEALLRTTEPTLARPDHFLDAATRLGRLNHLGRAVRARIAAELKRGPEGVRFYVNLHASDLTDDDLVVATAPLSALASKVTLEITERASLSSSGDLRSRIDAVRALGYRLAIDDLGAGYAGLSSLALIDPEVVKLDMSLVRGVQASPAKQEVIRSITKLATDLGMELIVEGVETPQERDTLAGLGCDLMQGYLFARPDFGFFTPAF
jgi:EAL domain-containing protein (putative c-di-GMP-specific phosphodiesterase class I)